MKLALLCAILTVVGSEREPPHLYPHLRDFNRILLPDPLFPSDYGYIYNTSISKYANLAWVKKLAAMTGVKITVGKIIRDPFRYSVFEQPWHPVEGCMNLIQGNFLWSPSCILPEWCGVMQKKEMKASIDGLTVTAVCYTTPSEVRHCRPHSCPIWTRNFPVSDVALPLIKFDITHEDEKTHTTKVVGALAFRPHITARAISVDADHIYRRYCYDHLNQFPNLTEPVATQQDTFVTHRGYKMSELCTSPMTTWDDFATPVEGELIHFYSELMWSTHEGSITARGGRLTDLFDQLDINQDMRGNKKTAMFAQAYNDTATKVILPHRCLDDKDEPGKTIEKKKWRWCGFQLTWQHPQEVKIEDYAVHDVRQHNGNVSTRIDILHLLATEVNVHASQASTGGTILHWLGTLCHNLGATIYDKAHELAAYLWTKLNNLLEIDSAIFERMLYGATRILVRLNAHLPLVEVAIFYVGASYVGLGDYAALVAAIPAAILTRRMFT